MFSSGLAHSFCNLTPQIKCHMHENNWNNTVGPNKFADFEKIEIEHLDPPERFEPRLRPITLVTISLFGTAAPRIILLPWKIDAGARSNMPKKERFSKSNKNVIFSNCSVRNNMFFDYGSVLFCLDRLLFQSRKPKKIISVP